MTKPYKCQETGCPYHPKLVAGEKVEVPFDGTKSARVMIIGESPGGSEERVGKPFVGRSGEVLEALLKHVGMERSEVFIANAARCRLDKDNDTVKDINDVVATCKKYVETAVKIVQPELIITLGAVSLRQMTKQQKILDNRGKFFDVVLSNTTTTEDAKGKKRHVVTPFWKGKVFSTVHPAFVLRGSSRGFPHLALDDMNQRERMLFEDFKHGIDTWRSKGESAKIKTGGYRIGTAEDLKTLSKAEVVAVDFETAGSNALDMHLKDSRILCCGFSMKEGEAQVFLADKKGRLPAGVVKLLQNPKVKKVVANRSFEDDVCWWKLGIRLGGPVHDVQLMAHLLDENAVAYNLSTLSDTFTELKGIKALAGGKRDAGKLDELPVDKLVAYNGVDCDATLRLFNFFKRKLNNDTQVLRYYVKFILPVTDMFAKMQMTGGLVDMRALDEAKAFLDEEVQRVTSEAVELVHPSIRALHADKGLSLTRPAFVSDVLFKHRKGFKLKPLKQFITPKTKEPSCSADHLANFPNNPFVVKFLEWSKIQKIRSSYIGKFDQFVKEDGKVYPTTFLNRTVTGRTSMKDPPMQTIPARGKLAKQVKKIFIAPKGWMIGTRDLSQSEIRIAGWLANDPNILGALEAGIDIHRKTASIVNNVSIPEVTKDMRQKAKAVNFGFLYGMSAAGIDGTGGFRAYAKNDYGIEFSVAECEAIRKAFFAKGTGYYMLPAYHNAQRKFVEKFGFSVSPMGRKRRLPEVYKSKAEQSRAFRQAINHPIQSFSSDLGLLASYLFQKAVDADPELRGNVLLLWYVHDALYFIAKTSVMQKAMALLDRCIRVESVAYLKENFGLEVGYPVASDGKVGQSWADLKDYCDKCGKVAGAGKCDTCKKAKKEEEEKARGKAA